MQITWLPAVQILKIAAAHAAIPAENTTALEPCSSAAIFFSRIATVGLDALMHNFGQQILVVFHTEKKKNTSLSSLTFHTTA